MIPKFRAWDKQLGKMFIPSYLATDSEWQVNWVEDQSLENIVLMQSTWLKDKNWKEIFEGDMLTTSNEDIRYDIWGKEEHWYTFVKKIDYDWVEFSRWYITFDKNSVYHYSFCEIIWNIYSNAELLTK